MFSVCNQYHTNIQHKTASGEHSTFDTIQYLEKDCLKNYLQLHTIDVVMSGTVFAHDPVLCVTHSVGELLRRLFNRKNICITWYALSWKLFYVSCTYANERVEECSSGWMCTDGIKYRISCLNDRVLFAYTPKERERFFNGWNDCTAHTIHISNLNEITHTHTHMLPPGHSCKGKYQFIRGNSLNSAWIGYFYWTRLSSIVTVSNVCKVVMKKKKKRLNQLSSQSIYAILHRFHKNVIDFSTNGLNSSHAIRCSCAQCISWIGKEHPWKCSLLHSDAHYLHSFNLFLDVFFPLNSLSEFNVDSIYDLLSGLALNFKEIGRVSIDFSMEHFCAGLSISDGISLLWSRTSHLTWQTYEHQFQWAIAWIWFAFDGIALHWRAYAQQFQFNTTRDTTKLVWCAGIRCGNSQNFIKSFKDFVNDLNGCNYFDINLQGLLPTLATRISSI